MAGSRIWSTRRSDAEERLESGPAGTPQESSPGRSPAGSVASVSVMTSFLAVEDISAHSAPDLHVCLALGYSVEASRVRDYLD